MSPTIRPGHLSAEVRQLAAGQWARWAPVLGQVPRVRLSPDWGLSFPKWKRGRRYEHALTDQLPAVPATVYLCNPDACAAAVLACDFDLKQGFSAAEVAADAADFAARVAAAGGRTVRTVTPSGGRHVWVRFTRPLPYEELKALAVAIGRRYPTLDVAPNLSAFGQLRPPGAPHKLTHGGRLSGFVLLDMTGAEEREALLRPCGPGVWAALLEEFTGELQTTAPARHAGPVLLDTTGAPWCPAAGGRRPLPARWAQLARTGAWRKAGYPTRSEARQAVLNSAAHAGWHLSDVQAAIGSGQWAGFARIAAHKTTWHLEHDWAAAVSTATSWKSAHKIHTRGRYPTPPSPPNTHSHRNEDRFAATSPPPSDHPPPLHPPPPRLDLRPRVLTDYQAIRQWANAVRLAERDPAWQARRGDQAISARLVLRALGAAAQMRGEAWAKWGVRSLAEATGLDFSTVADVLRALRADDDPLVVLEREHEGEHPDEYSLRIPDAYREAAEWMRWRAGTIDAVHHAFWAKPLGRPAALVYEALTSAETGAGEVQRLAVLSRSATTKALRNLAAYGLAERGPGGWRRGEADLDAVAAELGADQLKAAKREAHREQRRQWRAWLGVVINEQIGWVDELIHTIPEHLVAATHTAADAARDVAHDALDLITQTLGGRVLDQQPAPP